MTKAEIIDYVKRERDRYDRTSKDFANGIRGYADYINAEACRQRALALGLILTTIELAEKKK